MSSRKKRKKLIPKDYKNMNKHLSSKGVKPFIDSALILSRNCKTTTTDLLAEKFIDFMSPIQDIIQDLFDDLYKEIMIRYSEIYKSKDLDTFKKNINLVSAQEIHRLYKELENKILDSGTIILEKSNTLDSVYEIYDDYLSSIGKIAVGASKLKILAVINQIELIQMDTKNYINNLVYSISTEAFDLYSDDMDRYFLDIESFVDNNNAVMLDYIKSNEKIPELLDPFDDWANETKKDIIESKNKIFTHYKYKELNKLATDNGFNLNRVTGGHGIFVNDNGLVVVIPQGRDIGKGLQIKILKNIGIRS